MIIGIDVGGTYTDAVALNGSKIKVSFKIPTSDDILSCLRTALDQLAGEIPVNRWKRLVLSTTWLTNIVAQERYEKVALMMMPGPGVNPRQLEFPGETRFLHGAINYRGHEIESLNTGEIKETAGTLYAKGYRHLAVVGKFSGRNAVHENIANDLIKEDFPDVDITLGHQVTGYLNFPRRSVTTWLTAATKEAYGKFIGEINQVLKEYYLSCPVLIMKADGGVIPLEAVAQFPAATVYSGPAASTVGASALLMPEASAVVMDVGGSTTDLSLILSGIPLMAFQGIKFDDYLTQIKGLAMKSVPLGGDAPVEISGGEPVLLKERKGPAACFGGSHPTLTDAINITKGVPGIQVEESRTAFQKALGISEEKVNDFASLVVKKGAGEIAGAIQTMFSAWKDEPAYRVWEVLQKEPVFPALLMGIGGAAQGLTEETADLLKMKSYLPSFAEVANAVGCAVAKPTLNLRMHIDTGRKILAIDEDGIQQKFTGKISEEKAVELAKSFLIARGQKLSIEINPEDIEVVYCEIFSVIRGFYRDGSIVDVEVQIKPGLAERISNH